MPTANDRRIAKNTVFLYGRMLLTLGIQLYSSRVILEMLGVSNYGIYNVVGGIIVIISFLNGTMAGATQRFLNFEMGRNEQGNLATTFSAALRIHMVIALIMLLLGETVGLWYVNNQLVIPVDRMYVANWVYQLSLIAAVLTILQVPYAASVIAHERMDVFAILSLLLSSLKLGVALLLAFAGRYDRLIFYAWLMLGATAVIFICYVIYVRRNFEEATAPTTNKRPVVKNMLKYSVSDLFGTLSYTLNMQGIIIILNRFGGTVLNAAGGVTMTVSGALSQFGSAIITAFRPQIIKQYAAQDYDYMLRLMINCSKFATMLFAFIAIPAIVNMDFLLGIWLKEVPQHTAIFCQLAMVWAIGDLVKNTLSCGIHATGRVFSYSVGSGLIFIIELPLMYLLIEATDLPWVIYAVHVVAMGLIILATALILRRLLPQFAILRFLFRGVILPAVLITTTLALTVAAGMFFETELTKVLATSIVSSALLGVLGWIFVLDSKSRADVRRFIKNKIKH